MIYEFYGKNNLQFSIKDEDVFNSFWDFVLGRIHDTKVKEILHEPMNNNRCYVDKHTIIIMRRELESSHNRVSSFEYINDLLSDDHDSYRDKLFLLVVMMNFIRFMIFLKKTPSGFVMGKREH